MNEWTNYANSNVEPFIFLESQQSPKYFPLSRCHSETFESVTTVPAPSVASFVEVQFTFSKVLKWIHIKLDNVCKHITIKLLSDRAHFYNLRNFSSTLLQSILIPSKVTTVVLFLEFLISNDRHCVLFMSAFYQLMFLRFTHVVMHVTHMHILLILEQHGFELCGSTHTQMFFIK